MAAKAPNPAVVPDEDDDLDLWNAGPPRKAPPPPPKPDSSTSSDKSSENESEDERQGAAAAAKLRDHNASIAPRNAPKIVLPSVDAAFTAVEGPPAFLNPEATRQIPEIQRGDAAAAAAAAMAAAANSKDQGWDISRMAPKLIGIDEEQPQRGVISAAAKRFKTDDGEAAFPVVASAAQVAMLGGLPQQQGSSSSRDGVNIKKSSKAMGVEEFLGKGGAQLPRKRQDRKDKEKDKRGKGQSSHSHWKSEAEMALRQQYD